MPVSTNTQGLPVWRRRTTRAQWLQYLAWLAGVSLFLLCWKMISDNTMWVFVEDAGRQGADLISRMTPPMCSGSPCGTPLTSPLWAPPLAL